jgi:predicted ATPase
MHLERLEITGLRGFAKTECLELAIPNGKFGSGITILVGPNNAGKSTIVEAFTTLSRSDPQDGHYGSSISRDKRNERAGSRVHLQAVVQGGEVSELKTIEAGGALTETLGWNIGAFVVPSRRIFHPFFERFPEYMARSTYASQGDHPSLRSSTLDRINERIFSAHGGRDRFNAVLAKVVGPVPDWNIEQTEDGRYYLQFRFGNSVHSSDGLGDGLLSVWLIIDALYDSSKGEIIVIDEPEQSLHPSMQKRLFSLLGEHAKDRQIVYATHSPYFLNWAAVFNGARVTRVWKKEDRSVLSALKIETSDRLRGIARNLNNPHVLGLNAGEVFFLEDKVVLVEGQEDVVFYHLIGEQISREMPGDFFGWGVGGAGNMAHIAQMLVDLGFERVVGILDKDKEGLKPGLDSRFPQFKFFVIPAPDVRTKEAKPESAEVTGLVDARGKLRDDYKAAVEKMFDQIAVILTGSRI